MTNKKICIDCAMCRKKGQPGVDGHVIPRAFFEKIKRDSDKWIEENISHSKVNETSPKMQSMLKQFSANKHPKKRPIGPYEESVWCKVCEDEYFSACDNYAAQILTTPLSKFKTVSTAGKTYGYELEICDWKLLKYFVLTLVWRMAVADQELYKNVVLPDETLKIIKEEILKKSSAHPDFFSVLFYKSPGDPRMISDPKMRDFETIPQLLIYIGELMIVVRLSKLPYPSEMMQMVLGGEPKLLKIIHLEPDSDMRKAYGEIAAAKESIKINRASQV